MTDVMKSKVADLDEYDGYMLDVEKLPFTSYNNMHLLTKKQ